MISNDSFVAFESKMRQAGIPEPAINSFRYYFGRLLEGHSGMLPEESILPIESLAHLEDLPQDLSRAGLERLKKTVIIKLNGGLGTSMGLEKAKSLLTVKNGLSFLSILAHHSRIRGVPLVLMNSFATDSDTRRAIEKIPGLNADLPRTFLQNKVPKVDCDSFEPARYPPNPELEWCPPGHGDLYVAISTSGILSSLLREGYRYAFVSNSDNLGADLDPTILGYFAEQRLSFLMEVAERTEADRKGGHLARRRDNPGMLVLREAAQCPEADLSHFMSNDRHRFFNSNNLWIDLQSLADHLSGGLPFLKLPMICNVKNIDPRDTDSPLVYQLETAMGAAISMFERTEALVIPRRRFAPVKTCSDLLIVRSDATVLSEDFTVRPKSTPPLVDLDPAFYRLIDDLEERFPFGAPSLASCRTLKLEGDIEFGGSIILKGDVRITNRSGGRVCLRDNLLLENEELAF